MKDKSDNEVYISIEERDLISEFYFGPGYTGIFSIRLTWNDIMPVVEAIEELEEPHPSNNPEKGTVWPFQFEILSRETVQIIDNRDDSVIVTVNGEYKSKIEAVYKVIVEFIKWYNTQQK